MSTIMDRIKARLNLFTAIAKVIDCKYAKSIAFSSALFITACATPTVKLEQQLSGDYLAGSHSEYFFSSPVKIFLPEGEWDLAARDFAEFSIVFRDQDSGQGFSVGQAVLTQHNLNENQHKEVSNLTIFQAIHFDVRKKADSEKVAARLRKDVLERCRTVEGATYPLLDIRYVGCWRTVPSIEFSAKGGDNLIAQLEDLWGKISQQAAKELGSELRFTLREQLLEFSRINGLRVPDKMYGQKYLVAGEDFGIVVSYLYNPYLEGSPSERKLISDGKMNKIRLLDGLKGYGK